MKVHWSGLTPPKQGIEEPNTEKVNEKGGGVPAKKRKMDQSPKRISSNLVGRLFAIAATKRPKMIGEETEKGAGGGE